MRRKEWGDQKQQEETMEKLLEIRKVYLAKSHQTSDDIHGVSALT